MNTFKAINGAGLAILLVACSSTSAKRPPNSTAAESSGGATEANAAQTQTSATGTPTAESTASPSAEQARTAGARPEKVVRVPEDVKRDPEDLMTLMQQVRSQIVYKTKKIPGPEYEQVVKPSIADQLREAGFAEPDVNQILAGVDYSRRIQNIR